MVDTRTLAVGNRIEHSVYGPGTVTFVGADYLCIAFDSAGEALIRRESLERGEDLAVAGPRTCVRDTLPWPASTFILEDADAPQHYPGSHWNPFIEDAKALMGSLPDMLSQALVQTGYGEGCTSDHALPDDWPQGIQLVWPLRVQGVALIVSLGGETSRLMSMFPFFTGASQHTLTLREVTVWKGGVEAQISASWGEAEVTFFDTQYLINRTWYETGRRYDFVLSGIAYKAGPAERHEWKINRHPDEVTWMNQCLEADEKPHEAVYTLNMDGAAILLPVSGGDADDYEFHAPVKSVTEFSNWLGQDGWRVCATVMRFGERDADLDILITRRAWSAKAPPQIGQNIEGLLWLQGYLCWIP